LVTGGIIGTLIASIAVLSLLSLRFGLPEKRDRMFATLFAIVTLGSMLGFSPLSANRTSTFAWLIIALLVTFARYTRRRAADALALASDAAGGAHGTARVAD
jgi:hypothetical protein